MEYTVQTLGKLAGISTRTLRYYDEIGILTPARINSSGYRIYGDAEVRQLQQILFYKELGVSLEEIRTIVTAPNFDAASALMIHREKLLDKRTQLNRLIENVEKTIAATGGKIKMTDQEKFEGFKKAKIDENEAKYGKEIRKNYGDKTVNDSNKKFMNMSKSDHDAVVSLEETLTTVLSEAFKLGDPASELARKPPIFTDNGLPISGQKVPTIRKLTLDLHKCM